MRKVSVVISGATGWLGQAVISDILHGSSDYKSPLKMTKSMSIRALYRPGEQIPSNLIGNQIDWVECELSNTDDINRSLSDCEGATLIHTAGIIHPKIFKSEFRKTNLLGTTNLMMAAQKAGIKKAVVISSNSPMGCNPTLTHRFTEESPYNPYLGYGQSKYEMELYLKSLMAKKNHFPITIIRAPWFYGPNQPERQKTFFTMIRDGKGPIVGSGENVRSMAYVGNLAQGVLLAATNPKADNEIFWIADKVPYTMNTILNTIEKLLESEFDQICKGTRLKLPFIVGEIAYIVDWVIQRAGFYHQKFHVLSEMNKSIACSIEKAEKILGYNPTINLEEGMRRSLSEFFVSKANVD